MSISGRATYVEEWWRDTPDYWNGYAAGGDGDLAVIPYAGTDGYIDFWPAICRWMTAPGHIDHRTSESLRFQRTESRQLLFGRDHSHYGVSKTIHSIAGGEMIGLRGGGATFLVWATGEDGIKHHYPRTTSGPGTSENLPGLMAPFSGYGGGRLKLEALTIRGRNSAGTRGVVAYRNFNMIDCVVEDWGWHGIHITGDTNRATKCNSAILVGATTLTLANGDVSFPAGLTVRIGSLDREIVSKVSTTLTFTPSIDVEQPAGSYVYLSNAEDIGISNASGSELKNVTSQNNGFNSGYTTTESWITAANPNGRRQRGCALKIQGGDANIISTTNSSFNGCHGWAIDDNGFLGNTHINPHTSYCGEGEIEQEELDIAAAATGTEAADFNQEVINALSLTAGVQQGLAYRMRNDNARTTIIDAYVEGSWGTAVNEAVGQSFFINGIGGQFIGNTRKVQPDGMVGGTVWNVSPSTGSNGHPVEISPGSEYDVIFKLENAFASTSQQLRFKFEDEFIRWDWANSNSLVGGYMTCTGSLDGTGFGMKAAHLLLSRLYRGNKNVAVTDEFGSKANLPDLSDPTVAPLYPIGSQWTVRDSIPGGVAKYRCASDPLVTNGKRWIAAGQLANIKRGFFDRDESKLTFVSGTRTVSILPNSGYSGFSFNAGGTPYTLTTTQSYAFPDSEGGHLIYFNASGALTGTQNLNDFKGVFENNAPVAYVMWDAMDDQMLRRADERHTQLFDGRDQYYRHSTIGARLHFNSLLGRCDLTLLAAAGSDGSDDTHAEITVTGGGLYDEDILLETNRSTMTQQLTPVLQAPVFYLSGSNWKRRKPADNFPVIQSGAPGTGYTGANGLCAYNQIIANSGSLTQVSTGDYFLSHIFLTNDSYEQVIAILGQNTYATLALARTGADIELQRLRTTGLPTLEMVPLYSIIYQTATGYGNSVKARIVATEEGLDAVDWRAICIRV